MLIFWYELRRSLRGLMHRPGYAFVSVLVLSLGLAVTIFMFSAVKGMLLTSLPFPQPDQLYQVGISDGTPGQDQYPVPAQRYQMWRDHQQVFDDLAAYYSGTANLSGEEWPLRFRGAFVSANLFEVLQVTPMLGRGFRDGEDRIGEPLVIVLGADLWRHHFNEDPDILGRRVRFNGRDAEIVGVMPPGFRYPFNEEVWAPMQQDLSVPAGSERLAPLTVFGRLRDGVGAAEAGEAMQVLNERLRIDDGNERTQSVIVQQLAAAHLNSDMLSAILTMFVSVIFVLLIACSNVANLTLVRIAGRRREIAICASLGAGRARLVASVLIELALIGVVATVIGLALSEWGGRIIDEALRDGGAEVPYWVDYSLDWTLAGFALASGLAAALLAGVIPAWRAARTDPYNGLRDGGHGSSDARQGRLNRLLVTFQIALCCVLLICAGLTLRSAIKLNTIDHGLPSTSALTGRLGLFESTYPEAIDRARLLQRLQQELAVLPGVRHAALASALPMTGSAWSRYHLAGAELAPDTTMSGARYVSITSDYFDVFAVPMRQGRAFVSADDEGSTPVAIVNVAFAERAWPGRDAVGERLHLEVTGAEAVTIVGVVENFFGTPGEFQVGPQPVIFVPMAQLPPRFASLAVAVEGEPNRLAGAVRDVMLRVDPDTPIYWLRSFDEVAAAATFNQRLIAVLFTIFGVVAVVLTVTGFYAVLAYAVGRRTREIGIRRALGAADRSIVRMVVGQGWRQYLIGVGIGLSAAILFTQLLRNLLVGIGSFDPVTFGAVAAGLAALAVLASWLPARRALQVQPVVALRQE